MPAKRELELLGSVLLRLVPGVDGRGGSCSCSRQRSHAGRERDSKSICSRAEAEEEENRRRTDVETLWSCASNDEIMVLINRSR